VKSREKILYISKYITNTTSREEKKQLAMCPKNEWRYQTYTSRAQKFCFFFTSYHWFFSLIVGHWNTMDCLNCPSSPVFYDRLKWEIYAFYRQNGQTPGDNFQKSEILVYPWKYTATCKTYQKKGRVVRFVKYASIMENNEFHKSLRLVIHTTRDGIKMKRHAVICNFRYVTTMEFDRLRNTLYS